MIDHSLQSSVSESWQMPKKKETPNFYPITSEFAFAVHPRKITKTDSPCKTSEEILVGCYTGWTLQICSPQIKHKVLKYLLKALETKKKASSKLWNNCVFHQRVSSSWYQSNSTLSRATMLDFSESVLFLIGIAWFSRLQRQQFDLKPTADLAPGSWSIFSLKYKFQFINNISLDYALFL